jgi:hypothetical protein
MGVTTATSIISNPQELSVILLQFRRANLKLQPEKCVFAKDKVIYLGCELSYRGIEASPNKAQTVQNFPIPYQ